VAQRSAGAGSPTLDDVARSAAVSRQTVSNVLNAPDRVRPGTRERVRSAIDELGYRPNRAARSLRISASYMIGYRIGPVRADALSPVNDRFLHAVADAARGYGYHLVLFTPEDDADELSAYAAMHHTGTVDGFVLNETDHGDQRPAWLGRRGIPFAMFGRTDADDDGHPWVDVDNEAGTAGAVAHLVARGHRRIAFVGWPVGSATGDYRAAGWARGLQEAGLAADPTLDVRCLDGVEPAARAFAPLLDLADPPTAVVAASDALALGCLQGARDRGREVGAPADGAADRSRLGVVGFDDTPAARHVTPPLSSVRQPLEQAGREVVAALVSALGRTAPVAPPGLAPGASDAPAYETPRLLTPELVVRASS